MRLIMAGIKWFYFIVSGSSSGLDSKGHALWRGLVRGAPENAGWAAVSGGDKNPDGHAAVAAGAAWVAGVAGVAVELMAQRFKDNCQLD